MVFPRRLGVWVGILFSLFVLFWPIKVSADDACGAVDCTLRTVGYSYFQCNQGDPGVGQLPTLCYDSTSFPQQGYCIKDGITCTVREGPSTSSPYIAVGGCVDYDDVPTCATKTNLSVVGCCPAGGCTPEITAQGFKNIMPANTGDPLTNGLQVNLNNPASSTTAQPYSFTWTSQAGASRTISIPSVPAGYSVASSLCPVNESSCHGWYLGNPAYQTGNSRTILDDEYGNCGNCACTADLWWHFCQIPSAVQNIRVDGSANTNMCAGSATVRWDLPATGGNVVSHYTFKLDDLSTPFEPNCSLPQYGGDYCQRNVTDRFYGVNVVAGRSYRVEVFAYNQCGTYGPVGQQTFTAVSAPTAPTLNSVTNPAVLGATGSLTLNWTDNSSNETGFVIEDGALSYSVAANTTSYTNAPLTCGSSHTYTVSAVNSNYPVACRTGVSNSRTATANCCPALANPTNLAPASDVCVSGATLNTNLTWTAPATGSPTSYTVNLLNTTDGIVVVNDAVTANTTYPVTLAANKNYTMTITAVNACGSTSFASRNFSTVSGPPQATITNLQDIGLAVNVEWTISSNPQYFRIYKNGAYYGPNLAGSVRAYEDSVCVVSSYRIDSFDDSKPLGCRTAIGANTPTINCEPLNTSWFSASGGGNLVAATGEIRSSIPTTTFLPYLINSENNYPGIAVARSFLAGMSVNTQDWRYQITTPWDASGNNMLNDRENSYDGMKERVWVRTTPHSLTSVSLDQTNFDNEYGLTAEFAGTGVRIMYTTGNLSIGSGNLNLDGRRALIFVDGSVTLDGEITWDSANPGFLAVIARGNISINPDVGTDGLTMEVDVRPPSVPAHIMGIYYAQGVFSTGTYGLPSVRDRILKIDGTVVGMSNVSLQRRNVGRYPVEFFNFQPGLVSKLSEVGLRRKVVQELLNP